MKTSRRKFTFAFKAQVALEAIKERETLADLSKKFGVHAVMISKWKQDFLERSTTIFEAESTQQDIEQENQHLYAKIGQLEVERDWQKKFQSNLDSPPITKHYKNGCQNKYP